MLRVTRLTVLLIASGCIVAACTSSSSDSADTTTTAPQTITTLAPSTTVADTTTTLAPIDELSAPEYQIVSRSPLEEGGDEVVVLLDPTSYDSLTDIDVYDLIAEVVEVFPPVGILHIVDDATAANAVTDPDASEAARASLDLHYLARLENGSQITYLGPFASSGTIVLGS